MKFKVFTGLTDLTEPARVGVVESNCDLTGDLTGDFTGELTGLIGEFTLVGE